MIDARSERRETVFAEQGGLERAKDTGMAMTLISLLIAYFHRSRLFLGLAILLLIIDMVCPVVYKPLARIWFGLSHLLGAIVSRIILTLLFFILVTPMGLIRRALAADPLQLKKWKKGSSSVFHVRDKTFQPADVEKPY